MEDNKDDNSVPKPKRKPPAPIERRKKPRFSRKKIADGYWLIQKMGKAQLRAVDPELYKYLCDEPAQD